MATRTIRRQASEADHRRGFGGLEQELRADALEVHGELPPWLTGTLVRVTPAALESGGQRVAHWFDGLAMLNAFTLRDGRASYGSRFLRSEAYARRERGEPLRGGFATDPCRSIFSNLAALFSSEQAVMDNCNVNVARLGDRHIAMTETPMPIEFDPETLETLGAVRYADSLKGQVTTAHPHHDPARGELINYVTYFSARSRYRIYAQPAGSPTRRLVAELPASRPAYMHSFALTERYVVLVEFPLVVNPLRLGLGTRPFIENYRWQPGRGTRFLVVDRSDGSLRCTAEAEPFFSFHHVNAFEDGDELALDLVAYDDASVIDALYLDRLERPEPEVPEGHLRRYRVPLSGGSVRGERLSDAVVELPRIDYRRNGRPYRTAFAVGGGGPGWLDRLVRLDVDDGTAAEWSEPGCYPGEPVFVPRPGAAEDDGAVLSVVLDAAANRSFLVVLDAGSFEELARVDAPHGIPFGFHGQFFGSAA